MRLKLDENLGERGAALLRNAGFDVATVFEQGLTAASDVRLAKACTAEDRCLVTLDIDFANPLRYPPDAHAGLVVLRLPNRITRAGLDAALDLFARVAAGRSLRGRLWIVEVDRIREHLGERGGSGT